MQALFNANIIEKEDATSQPKHKTIFSNMYSEQLCNVCFSTISKINGKTKKVGSVPINNLPALFIIYEVLI